MDIVILSHFCMEFSRNDNDRFLYIAKRLADRHEVEIITSDFFHTKKVHRREVLSPQPCKVTFLHEPGYAKNVCLKRFYSHYAWGREVKKYLAARKRPDVIYCAVPSLTAAGAAAEYCRKNGIRFLVDIQDLWPEAFEMVLHIPCISTLIFYPIRLIANSIYKAADGLAAVSETYLRRGLEVNRKCKCSETVFLGTRLSDFDSNCKNLPMLEKKEGELWLGIAALWERVMISIASSMP